MQIRQADASGRKMNIPIEEIHIESGSMRFFRFGTGTKTLVILPGLSVQSVMLSASAVAEEYGIMKDDFTVYVFDRRTDLPPVYSIREMASDTFSAMSSLGLQSTCLFGASQGGMIAMVLAVEHPGLIHRLVLGSSSPCVDASCFSVIREWIRLAEAGDREALYLSFGRRLYPPHVFRQLRDGLISVARTVSEEDLQRFIILAAGTEHFEITDRLDEIRCPVLAIGASDDAVLGPDAISVLTEKLRDNPGFQSYVYSGYGHASFDTAPDYQERLFRFFTGD